jgi:hypothetical protein
MTEDRFAHLIDFIQEVECDYKGEHYSVRDNGAVFRHSLKNKKPRKYDNFWTFGKPNKNGYLLIVSEVIHRIVAHAFHGEPPTKQHVVDHIDTNRKNNRPENLRWLTKLENILNNPITVKKIVSRCGTIEAFLENPSILKNYVHEEPNFDWMRMVSPEEAKISWKRLNEWAHKKDNNTQSKGGSLGEWIYQDTNYFTTPEIPEFTASLTPNALQKNWKTPCEFPNCPKENISNPIVNYTYNLKSGETFSRNQYSNSIIEEFAISKDEKTLWVMSKNSDKEVMKPWSLAEVTYKNDLFIHANLGSFFRKDGIEKEFTLVQGLEWKGGDTYDDFVS